MPRALASSESAFRLQGIVETGYRALVRVKRWGGDTLPIRRSRESLRIFPSALQMALAILLAFVIGNAHAQVQHIYDENGRLAGTIDPTGNGARFTYDAAGNITAIARLTPTQVSIIERSPRTSSTTD